jgi:hypothetical protein
MPSYGRTARPISLSLSPKLSDENMKRVIDAASAILTHNSNHGLRYA